MSHNSMEASEDFRTAEDESPEAAEGPVPGEGSREGSTGEPAFDAPTGEDVSAPADAGIDHLSEPGEVEGDIGPEPVVEERPDEEVDDPDALPEPSGDEAFVAPSGEVAEVEEPRADAAPMDREADEPVEDDSIAEDLAGLPDVQGYVGEEAEVEEAEVEEAEVEEAEVGEEAEVEPRSRRRPR